MQVLGGGDSYASIILNSVIVATVGGGASLPFFRVVEKAGVGNRVNVAMQCIFLYLSGENAL